MAVIKTSYVLLTYVAKKGVNEVPIKSIKPACLRLSRLLGSVEMKLKGIFCASACIAA